MRKIVCNFACTEQFFSHLRRSSLRTWKQDSLCFLGDFDLRPGESVRVTVCIANCDERYDLRMSITSCRASNASKVAAIGTVYRYEATIIAEDAIWLEMFIAKVATRANVEQRRHQTFAAA